MPHDKGTATDTSFSDTYFLSPLKGEIQSHGDEVDNTDFENKESEERLMEEEEKAMAEIRADMALMENTLG